MDCAKAVENCPLCNTRIEIRIDMIISQLPDASQLQLWAGEGVSGAKGGGSEVIELISSDDDE